MKKEELIKKLKESKIKYDVFERDDLAKIIIKYKKFDIGMLCMNNKIFYVTILSENGFNLEDLIEFFNKIK